MTETISKSRLWTARIMNRHGTSFSFIAFFAVFLISLTVPADTFAQNEAVESGYAPVNGLELYYEIHGEGEPLILLHGGLGSSGMFYDIMPQLARDRQVVAVDLQGHGRTADVDRPIRYEHLGDDVAALIRHLGFEQVDVMGYSMGGGAALRAAIQHPGVVRRLVVVSAPYRRDGFYPEILEAQAQVNAEAAGQFKGTPMYQHYVSVAPEPDHFPRLLDKMGQLMSRDYDWSEEIRALDLPILLVYADADMFPTSHMARFYELLGGGQRDAGWDGSQRPTAQFAILPGLTHYDVFTSPLLATVANQFLDDPSAP